MVRELIHLFFPRVCPGCSEALLRNEKLVCYTCFLQLPQTDYHQSPFDNPINRLFWGRVPIYASSAFLYFRKSGVVQELLHALKYGNQPEIGSFLGAEYGKKLMSNNPFCSSDLILPVPLHSKREQQRGYNQSVFFAEGLSENLKIETSKSLLKRTDFKSSQTKKGRFERWQNVSTVFEVSKPEKVHDKHVLLVDDVITTGATIEACARQLFLSGASRVSVLCIAAPVN
jgi:ComF family protein